MRTRFHAFFNPIASLIPVLCIALATSLQSMGASAPVRGIGRHFVRSVNADNSGATDTLEWYCDESILYELFPRTRSGGHIAIPTNATASWIVLDPATSNTYICASASTVTPKTVSFFLPPGAAALPRDINFESYVLLLDGTNLLGVADHAYARCLWSPLAPAVEVTPTNALLPLIQAAIDAFGDHYATHDWVAEYVAEHGGGSGGIDPHRIVAEWEFRGEGTMDHSNYINLFDFISDYMASRDWVRLILPNLRGLSNSVSSLNSSYASLYQRVDNVSAAVTATSNAIPSYAYNPGGYAYPDYIRSVTVEPSTKRHGWSLTPYDIEGTTAVCNVSFETRIQVSANTFQAKASVLRSAPGNFLQWRVRDPRMPQEPDYYPMFIIDEKGWIYTEYNGNVNNQPCIIQASTGSYTCSVQTNMSFRFVAETTNNIFIGPAASSLLEDAWGLYANALTNTMGCERIWQTNPKDSVGVFPDFSSIAYAPDFWAGGATNFAWMSVAYLSTSNWSHARPAHLITPRHVVMAHHYGPTVDSTIAWIGEDGTPVLRRLVARRRVCDDVAVGLLDSPIPATSIRPVSLLRTSDAGYFYGDTNGVTGKQGWPVLAFDRTETAWFMWAQLEPYVNSSTNRARTFPEPGGGKFSEWMLQVSGSNSATIARSREYAVIGDSGSAVCLYSPNLNGGRPVLLGCYEYADSIPQLASLENSEYSLQAAIDSLGNPDHYAITYADFSGWTNPDIPAPPVTTP